jgi:hypothetical protein
MINDILENTGDKSARNNTPVSTNSKNMIFNEDSQISDENVYNNFKHISQSCDNLLSKDNIDTVNLTSNNNSNVNNDSKTATEISDISDDVSVMSEFIIDEPDNKPTFSNVTPSQEKPKATRGRKKKN